MLPRTVTFRPLEVRQIVLVGLEQVINPIDCDGRGVGGTVDFALRRSVHEVPYSPVHTSPTAREFPRQSLKVWFDHSRCHYEYAMPILRHSEGLGLHDSMVDGVSETG